jgi:Alginate lyase
MSDPDSDCARGCLESCGGRKELPAPGETHSTAVDSLRQVSDPIRSTRRAIERDRDEPVLRFLDIERLEDARLRLGRGEEFATKSFETLRWERRHAMRIGPFSVVGGKPVVAPSGDPHDFVSIPAYHWPNPDTPDGLPWVFVDGKKNPRASEFDSPKLFKMLNALEVLTLSAWYYDDRAAAERVAMFLRNWFLDDATRMNPHLTYAQLELGKPRGNSIGIIDFQRGYLLLDLLQVLRLCTDVITPEDVRGIREWFAELLEWIVTSDLGHEECARLTNHGTWYDAQVVAYRLFLGDREGAAEWLLSRTLPRMAKQITLEGDQPRESCRVFSLQYCVFNLFGLCVLAELGRSAEVDVWNHTADAGQGIRVALDWLLPYLVGEQVLDGPITKVRGTFSVSAEAIMTLRLAAERFGDQRYTYALERFAFKRPGCRSDLLVPARPNGA